MAPPTLQEAQSQPDKYTVEKTASGYNVQEKAQSFRPNSRDDQRQTYIPSEFSYNVRGELQSGVVRGIRVRSQNDRRYLQAVYTEKTYKRVDQGIEENVYELISKNNGGESVKFMERNLITPTASYLVQSKNNLSPTQIQNRQYQEFKQTAKDAGVGSFTRSQYDKLSQRDIQAIQERAAQNKQLQQSQQQEVYTKPGGFTKDEARNLIAQKLFEKQGKQALFDEQGNAVVVAPLGAKIDARAAAAIINKSRSTKQEPHKKEEAPDQFGLTEISAAPKQSALGKFEDRTRTFLDRNQGTTAGLLAGTGFGIYRFSKGFVKGVTAPFRPSTYVNLYRAVTNPKETLEAIGELGPQIQQDPGLVFEIGGELYGFDKAVGAVRKVARVAKQPTVVSKSGTEVQTIQLQPDKSLAVARTNTVVKVGGKTYPVVSAGKELSIALDESGLQLTIAKVGAKGQGAEVAQYVLGGRVVKADGSVGIEQAAIIAKRGGKTFIGSRTTQSVTREIVNYQGLSSEAGASITQGSKLVKTSEKALSQGKVPKGALKQTQSELAGSISKEIYAVDKTRGSLALTFAVRGKSALEAIKRAITKRLEIVGPGRKANVDAISGAVGGSGAQASGKVAAGGTQSQLVQNLEGAAKQAAKQAYLAEPSTGVPGVRPPNVVKEIPVTKSSQKTEVVQKTEEKQEQARKVKIVSAVDATQVQETAPVIKQTQGSRSAQTFDIAQIQDTAQDQGQEQAQEQIQEQIQITRQRTRSSQTPFSSVVPSVPTGPLIVPKRANEEAGGPIDLFTTFVRRRGKFQAIGSFEDPSEAVRAGANIVQGTAAASFKVVGKGGALEQAYEGLNRAVYRRSKREPGVVIERVSSRINTPGELGEITFKGIASSRSSKKRRKNPLASIFGGA